MSKENGGPAFPIYLPTGEKYDGHMPHDGMTLRDYFAAKAMQGWSANPIPQDSSIQEVAEWAYRQADAMLEARAK